MVRAPMGKRFFEWRPMCLAEEGERVTMNGERWVMRRKAGGWIWVPPEDLLTSGVTWVGPKLPAFLRSFPLEVKTAHMRKHRLAAFKRGEGGGYG